MIVPWSPEGFAEGILWCLENPEAAREMAARGRAWVGRHRTYDRLADLVHRHLLHALAPASDASLQPRGR